MKFNKDTWNWWWQEWIKPILIAGILALIIRTFVIQPFKIPSNSMYPTLKPGDRIFVSKFIYGAKIPFTNFRLPEVRDPKFGDIIVFLSPEEKKKYLVKRYIGMAFVGDLLRSSERPLVVVEFHVNLVGDFRRCKRRTDTLSEK